MSDPIYHQSQSFQLILQIQSLLSFSLHPHKSPLFLGLLYTSLSYKYTTDPTFHSLLFKQLPSHLHML